MIDNAMLAWDDAPVDVSAEVNMIWSVANKLRGPYRPEKYKDVIIPMTIIRRLECALSKTKQEVVDQYEQMPTLPAALYEKTAGQAFYNTSRFDLNELLNDPINVAENFRDYIRHFSSNVQDILASLEFDTEITKMDTNDRLYTVIRAFAEIDLSVEHIDSIKMGYVFEDLIRRFSENAEAGDHYTGRDIVKLMVALLLAEGSEDVLSTPRLNVRILDQAAGTGGILSTAYNYIHHFAEKPGPDVRLYAQEINPESYAICLAEMLIKGQDASNIRLANSLTTDCYEDTKFRYVAENPPFGIAWAGQDAPQGTEQAVRDENAKAYGSRYPAGLPSGGDSQLLFVQSAVDKLDDNGRAAIIENGSPLFSGGTSSGESQIRRWLLESDYLEAIVALPTDLFYNTGIQTYIWVLTKSKTERRRGKVQLIDASGICHKLRKSLGSKRNEITPEDRAEVVRLYTDFADTELSQIHDTKEFLFKEYTVMRPLQRSYAMTDERIDAMLAGNALAPLYDPNKVAKLEAKQEDGGTLTAREQKQLDAMTKGKDTYDAIVNALRECRDDTAYPNPTAFMPVLEQALSAVTPPVDRKLLTRIADGLSAHDETADIQVDRKGNPLWDKETKDTEIVKETESVEEYMAREVTPYVPDARWFFDEDRTKRTPVIKSGASIPFSQLFYKYEQPEPSEDIKARIVERQGRIAEQLEELFGGKA